MATNLSVQNRMEESSIQKMIINQIFIPAIRLLANKLIALCFGLSRISALHFFDILAPSGTCIRLRTHSPRRVIIYSMINKE